MDVRGSLLALLTLGPCHGAQLATELAERTGTAVNPGQVAKTLVRLERDGIVTALPRDAGGRIPYDLTEAGRREATDWLAAPAVDFTQLALVATLPGADATVLLGRLRAALDEAESGLRAAAPHGLAEPARRGRPPRSSPAAPDRP